MLKLDTASGFKMPKGVWSLFCIQMVSTLSFSVLYSTLVLYMTGKLGMASYEANSIMGVFVAFNYALHLLGGYWGGKFLSFRLLFCIGMISLTLGCVFLSFTTQSFLYLGLAFFLTGSGLNVTCLNCILTQMFPPEDKRRETAFLWSYASMNVGFLVGFTLSGYYQLSQDYQMLFILSSLGNIVAFFLCLLSWNKFDDKNTIYSKKTKKAQKNNLYFILSILIILPFILSKLLHHAAWANKLVLLTGMLMLLTILYLGYKQDKSQARNKMYAFSVFLVVSVIFWMLYQIAPMGLVSFINYNVQREVGTWIIPPQWFQNINTICIIIGGPLMTIIFSKIRAQGIDINIPTQFSCSLCLIGLSFVILPLGIANANADGFVNPNWVVLSFILQSAGELLISPIGYAMIGALAPTHLQGIMMGVWMLTTGVGATLSSYSSNWMIAGQETVIPTLTNPGYSRVFLILGIFAIAASFLLFLVIPKLKLLMQGKVETALEVDSKLSQV